MYAVHGPTSIYIGLHRYIMFLLESNVQQSVITVKAILNERIFTWNWLYIEATLCSNSKKCTGNAGIEKE